MAVYVGGSKVDIGVCLEFRNIRKGLELLKGEIDRSMV